MKCAARHMIPAEMLAALVSIVAGVVAAIGHTPLWHALAGLKPWLGLAQNAWFGWALILGGAALFLAAMNEWRHGRHWGGIRLMIYADIRCGAALVLLVTHASLFCTLLFTGNAYPVWGFMWVAPVMIAFLAWSAVKTRRLSIALDAKYVTPHLDAEIRRNW